MKHNIGSADRIIRFILAVVIAILYFTNVITGTLGLVLTIVAVIFFVTSLIGTCPIYLALGLSTKNTISTEAKS